MKKWICLLLCSLMVFPALGAEYRVEKMDESLLPENMHYWYLGEEWVLCYDSRVDFASQSAYLYHSPTGSRQQLWGAWEEWEGPIRSALGRLGGFDVWFEMRRAESADAPILMMNQTVRSSWQGEKYTLVETSHAMMLIDIATGECRNLSEMGPAAMLADDTLVLWQMGDDGYALHSLSDGKERKIALDLPGGYSCICLKGDQDGSTAIVREIPEKMSVNAVSEYRVCFFDEKGGMKNSLSLGRHPFLNGPEALLPCRDGVLAYGKNIMQHLFFCRENGDQAGALCITDWDIILMPLDQVPVDQETGVITNSESKLVPIGVSRDGREIMLVDFRGALLLYDLSNGVTLMLMDGPRFEEMDVGPVDLSLCRWDGEDLLTCRIQPWFRLVRESQPLFIWR